jgi:hypothetical protein
MENDHSLVGGKLRHLDNWVNEKDPVSCIAEMLMQQKFPPIYGMKAVAGKIA